MVSEERGGEGFGSGQPRVVGLEPATQPAAHVHTGKGTLTGGMTAGRAEGLMEQVCLQAGNDAHGHCPATAEHSREVCSYDTTLGESQRDMQL